MSTLWQDLRYGMRLLLSRPSFTVVAVATLALGIGANTAIFSVVNAVLLRPLPYPDPQTLVTMRSNQSLPDLVDIKAQSQSFEKIGGAVVQPLDFTGGAEPLQVQAALTGGELFDVLGARPLLGRALTPDEDRAGGARSVVLAHGFWQRQFGGDPGILGQSVPLSGQSYTIVGVMPREFVMPRETPDLFASVQVVLPDAARARGVHFLRTYCRLKPGVGLAQAQGEMEGIDRRLAEADPAENRGRRTLLIPLHERVVGESRTALLILFGAVGLVLLIACANFANLLLARAASREQELTIRAALGAGRARLVRQMLTESLLLAALGGALGLALASWGIDLLKALSPANLPRLSGVGVDATVLAFTFAVAALTGVIFGLVPALLATRMNVGGALKEGGRGATAGRGRSRLRGLLVTSEVALALVLLTGAGLLVRTFWRLRSVEPGFDPAGLLTMRVELPEARYKETPKQTQFRRQVGEALASIPGARAAMVSELPLAGEALMHNFLIEGRPPLQPGEEPELFSRSVGGDYFRLMGIPLLRGRDFTAQDREGAPLVGVVNESFVREYFPGGDALGARVRWARASEPQWITIVGVAGDVRHFGLSEEEEPAIYTPYAQNLQPWKRWMYLAVRSDADTQALTEQVKRQVWSVDPQIPLTKVRTMGEVLAASLARQRFNMTLLGLFAAVALLLAAVGIYGVIAYTVAQRTHEVGVRMALGARAADILRLVVGQGMTPVLLGVALGLLASLALTRLMRGLLFGVSATDPATIASVSLLLAAVALLACLVPARRAAKVDPMVALRYQ